MKTSLLTILLFFSCLSFVIAQKRYKGRIITLDNKVKVGLFFRTEENGISLLPNGIRLDKKEVENNIPNLNFIDFETIKYIEITREGRTELLTIAGLMIGIIATRVFLASNKDFESSVKAIFVVTPVSTGLGLAIGNIYPHQFKMQKDSVFIQNLKTELKKYEWYHADEGMVK
jgi:uncharacterized membrane protein